MKPTIGLVMGDPSGIGPELAAKLLASPQTLTLRTACGKRVQRLRYARRAVDPPRFAWRGRDSSI